MLINPSIKIYNSHSNRIEIIIIIRMFSNNNKIINSAEIKWIINKMLTKISNKWEIITTTLINNNNNNNFKIRTSNNNCNNKKIIQIWSTTTTTILIEINSNNNNKSIIMEIVETIKPFRYFSLNLIALFKFLKKIKNIFFKNILIITIKKSKSIKIIIKMWITITVMPSMKICTFLYNF